MNISMKMIRKESIAAIFFLYCNFSQKGTSIAFGEHCYSCSSSTLLIKVSLVPKQLNLKNNLHASLRIKTELRKLLFGMARIPSTILNEKSYVELGQ